MNLIKKYWIGIVIIFAVFMFIKPALCFLILGSLMSFIAIEAVLSLKNIQKKGVECTGTIVEYQRDSKGYQTPVIEFTTMAGELIKEQPFVYVSTDLSKIRTYKNMVDQTVVILYDPDDPKKFILASEKGFSYLTLLILLLGGLVFIGLSISSLLGYIKMG